ncbi:MAG: tetratricopeptide repeat protein [candidate division KSB1 bacterium]|nr:tetratricopeptide repeat protein [candidate division KSB1 bacterium]MDZ7273897.1 tetratricopeptide repeat protein [candidate division KSB1 bacterium]MDZ7286053.1 tetratricopeptide repeat protein [candidate division KSB1 bacterium]MDZ7299085.1 tetratricopeptide repeat protein [candidate division KSB1 bacterium]MDZ7306388.1 tetratricopeptide repeat protein [candidate division KSB1 bacterium]
MRLTLARCGILYALCWLLLPLAAAAQSHNEEANKWFKSGLRQKNADLAMAAYQRALELDPEFQEALYNLALLHRKRKAYAQARELLERARSLNAGSNKADLRFKIVYELAALNQRLDDLEAAEEALRQAFELAPEARLRTQVSLDLGRLLYQGGRYREALTELQQGRQHATGNQAEFDKLIPVVEEAVRLFNLYQQAAKERAHGNFEEALALLRQIEAEKPGFMNVGREIASLGASLETAAREEVFHRLYLQAQSYEADDRLELAIATYENLLQSAPGYKDAETRLQRVRRRLQDKQRLLNVRPWLARLQADSGRAVLEARARRYYLDGRRALASGNYTRALVAFEKARELNPYDSEVDTLLARVRSHLLPAATVLPFEMVDVPAVIDSTVGDSAAPTAAPPPAPAAEVMAVTIEPAISRLHDEDTSLYSQIEFAEEEQEAVVAAGLNWGMILLVAAIITALVVLPFSGVFPYSDQVRAQAFLLLRDFNRAASIYEKLLEQNPRATGLYSRLAEIYLRAGRTDGNALKVYESVLQMSLPTPNWDRISSIVAQSRQQRARATTPGSAAGRSRN